jgi:hypothetical protein
MKNLLAIITILLLVSCNKEERGLKDTWIVYQSYTRSTNQQNWQDATYNNPFECKITNDSWSLLIDGKCNWGNGEIIPEVPNNNKYYYTYTKSTDEIRFDVYTGDLYHWKRFLKRK